MNEKYTAYVNIDGITVTVDRTDGVSGPVTSIDQWPDTLTGADTWLADEGFERVDEWHLDNSYKGMQLIAALVRK